MDKLICLQDSSHWSSVCLDQVDIISSRAHKIWNTPISDFFLEEAEWMFDFSDLNEKDIRVAKHILAIYVFWQRPAEIVQYIQSSLYGLNDIERFKILKYIAIHDWRRASEYFDLFWINNENEVLFIANICSVTHARRTCKHIRQFRIDNEYQRYNLAMSCCLSNAPSVLEYIENFRISSRAYFFNIIAKALLVNPGGSIKMIEKLPYFSRFQGIDDAWDVNSINEWVDRISWSEKNNNCLISDNARNIFNRIPRREMGIRVLAWYIIGWELCRNDHDAVSILTWLSIWENLMKDLSDTTKNDFLDLVLDLQSRYNQPIWSWIHLSDTTLQTTEGFKKIMKFFASLNLLSQARWVTCWSKKEELAKNINILLWTENNWVINLSLTNMDSIIDIIDKLMYEEVIDSAVKIGNWELTRNDITSLEWKIKDMAPIFIILARFIWKTEWHDAIDYFILILHSINNNTFSNIKYWRESIDDTDLILLQEQRNWLNDEQVALWEDNRSILGLVGENGQGTPLWQLTDIVNLIGDSIKYIEDNEWLDDTVLDHNMSPVEFLELKDKDVIKIAKEKFGWNFSSLLLIILRQLNSESNTEIIRRSIAKIKSLKDFFLKAEPVRSNIGSISEKLIQLRPVDSDIIFTTEIDHPYTVFTLTQLMKLSSCLNYSNWTELQALISYALDFNIKLVASFVIRSSDFHNRKEYLELVNVLKNNPDWLKYEFNPWKYTINYSINWISKVIELGSIVFRQFLKLWKGTDDMHCIGLEPWMVQVYPWIELVKEIANNLIMNKLFEMGIKTSPIVHIPKSRSKLGSYSDINHGRHLEAFTMSY